MKHSMLVKFLVLLLTALALVAAIGGGAGIVALERAGLYVRDLDTLQDQELDSIAKSLSESFARRYAVVKMGNLPYVLRERMYPNPADRSDAEHWKIQLKTGEEVLVAPGDITGYSLAKTYTVTPLYPLVSLYGPGDAPEDTQPSGPSEPSDPSESPTEPESPAPASSMYQELVVPEGYLYYEQDTQWNGAGFTTYYLYYYEAPEYQVTVYMNPAVLESSSLQLLTNIFPFRYEFIAVLILGVVLFFAGLCYLCWSAGRTPEGNIRPGGLFALPLDLYLLGSGGAVFGAYLVWQQITVWVSNEGPHPGNLSLAAVNLLVIAIILLSFLCAVSAQLKVKDGYWWRHSCVGWCMGQIARFFRFLGRSCRALMDLLPLIWQWVVVAAAMAILLLVAFLLTWSLRWGWVSLVPVVLFCAAVVLYGGYAFGTLLRAIRRLHQGDFGHKVSTRFLYGNFREFAEELNSLQDTVLAAAENETRAERMKSELITNVSHDIKTPLTSIINFVDLLQKPHSPEESEEYLEVLSRQSARMKKLIEDLLELSRANSGNTPVKLSPIDPVEAVNQALGEFSDKLEEAKIEPVFRCPDTPLCIFADGRLTWRILSNLLSNAVKYAMPDTRLYVDLLSVEDKVFLSLKNISRQELNISAQELMDRFVRGDASRNSEGSGLGLNIAKSLMVLQGGEMELLVDGDLFKVTLTFPLCRS